jgi:hypothetical protein
VSTVDVGIDQKNALRRIKLSYMVAEPMRARDLELVMRRIFDYFERTYVINLPDRIDRRQGTEHEFKRIGMEIPSEKIRVHFGARPEQQGEFYSLGAKGSFYAHRAALRRARKSGLNNVLVVEDDIGFNYCDPRVIGAALEQIGSMEWDVIYFGYMEPPSPAGSELLIPWSGKTIGGHFYAVNGHFFDEMIAYMDACEARPAGHPEGGPVSRDGAYNLIRQLKPVKTFIMNPSLAGQRSSRSDIAPRFFDKVKILKPLVTLGRRIKSKVMRPG